MRSLRKQESVGLLVGAALRAIKRAVLARTRPSGLESRRFWVLVAVLESRAASPHELAARLHVDEPTISRTLRALSTRGFVRVERDPRDRRRALVRPTAQGVRLGRSILPLAADIRASIVRGIGAPTQRAMREGLHRIILNMERARSGGPRAVVPPARRRKAG